MMTLARRNGDNAYHWDGKNQYSPDTVVPANTWQVFTQVYGEGDSAHQQLFLNGHPLIDSKTTAAYAVDASEMYLGNYQSGSNFLIGDLVEWIVFERVLAPAERKIVQDYLKKRGGLLLNTATPPGFTLHLEPSTQIPVRLSLSWPAILGQEYDLERSETMSFDSWVRDRTVIADRTGTFQLEITPAPGSRSNFYRLRQN